MNLSHFPSEILAHILSPPRSSVHCIRLWKTGDRLLQQTLTSAIISLELRPTRSQFQIPSIVFKLPKLRHFTLQSLKNGPMKTFHHIGGLHNLPRTLESLKLCFAGIHNCLTNYDLSSEVTPTIPSTSTETSTTSMKPIKKRYPLGVSRYMDLNALFPRLSSLTLKTAYNDTTVTARELFPVLPSNLTELGLVSLEITHDFASMLPKGLIKLNCEIDFGHHPSSSELFSDAWFDAPPHLAYIKSISLSCQPPLAWLPKSITLIGSCYLMLSSPQNICLPTNDLGIASIDDGRNPNPPPLVWTAQLPQTLTDLSFYDQYGDPSLPLTHLHCLPPSLTRLHATIEWSNRDLEDTKKLDLSKLWPPALTHLILDTRDFGAFMALLPPTLKILNTYELSSPPRENERQTKLDLRALPPLLHTFTTHFNLKLIEHWPSNLKSLKITSSTKFEDWPTLPQSLTEFHWHRGYRSPVIDGQSLMLPSQLTTVSLAGWRTDWFHLIPRVTTHLDLNTLACLSDATIEPNHFSQLPISLTKLRIWGKTLFDLSSTSLAHLCNLISFDTQSLGFPSAGIVYLPRMMTSLSVRLTSVNLADLRFLPSSLERCDLGLDATDSAILNYWPCGIVQLLPESAPLPAD